MRNLVIIGMLLAAASMAGWFSINRDGDRTTIEINRDEIRNDARVAIDRSREFLDRREQQQRLNQQQNAGNGQYYPPAQVATQNSQSQNYPTTYDNQNYYPTNQPQTNQVRTGTMQTYPTTGPTYYPQR